MFFCNIVVCIKLRFMFSDNKFSYAGIYHYMLVFHVKQQLEMCRHILTNGMLTFSDCLTYVTTMLRVGTCFSQSFDVHQQLFTAVICKIPIYCRHL